MGISFLFLQPNINQLLGNLGAKRSQFDNAAFGILDVRSLIHDSLVIQQNASQALGQAVSPIPFSVTFERCCDCCLLTNLIAHQCP